MVYDAIHVHKTNEAMHSAAAFAKKLAVQNKGNSVLAGKPQNNKEPIVALKSDSHGQSIAAGCAGA